jgi:hypothetical protein
LECRLPFGHLPCLLITCPCPAPVPLSAYHDSPRGAHDNLDTALGPCLFRQPGHPRQHLHIHRDSPLDVSACWSTPPMDLTRPASHNSIMQLWPCCVVPAFLDTLFVSIMQTRILQAAVCLHLTWGTFTSLPPFSSSGSAPASTAPPPPSSAPPPPSHCRGCLLHKPTALGPEPVFRAQGNLVR